MVLCFHCNSVIEYRQTLFFFCFAYSTTIYMKYYYINELSVQWIYVLPCNNASRMKWMQKKKYNEIWFLWILKQGGAQCIHIFYYEYFSSYLFQYIIWYFFFRVIHTNIKYTTLNEPQTPPYNVFFFRFF